MSFDVAVISRGRAATVRDKTIRALLDAKIPAQNIVLFAHPPEYGDYYFNLHPLGVEVVRGGETLREQRIAERLYWPQGAPVLWCDDDVDHFLEVGPDGNGRHLPDLARFGDWMFANARQAGANLWGMYPVANAFFMKPIMRKGLWFCIGQAQGVFNDRDLRLVGSPREDWEHTLVRFVADGVVLRWDGVAPAGRLFGKGGMTDELGDGRRKLNDDAVDDLLKRFPELIEERPPRSNGQREVRVRSAVQRA